MDHSQHFAGVQLFDGAYVRMDTRSHPNPVFIADYCGSHYNIAGEVYGADGLPANPKAPKVLEVVRYQ